ncbi:hypothetical protein GCM10023199_12750 [Actinomycetospora chibensis]
MLPTIEAAPPPVDINPYPGMPPMILPSPPDFSAGPIAGWFFTLYAGAAVIIIALVWATYTGFRKHNWLPLILIGGGFLCSLLEPMLDLLGHLRWANDLPFFVFTNFGIDIPLLIPFCYAAFLGLEPYFVYLVLKRGVTVKQLFMVYAVCGLTDAVMETPGLLLNVYEYYGVQPYSFLKFPYWWGFLNGLCFLTIGFVIWYLEPRLKGFQRAWFLVIPPTVMAGTYFSVGWPHFLALNSTLPVWLKWVATTIMMAGCLVWVYGMSKFVCVDEPTVNWTFRRLITYRLFFFLPSQREKMLDDLDREGPPTPKGTGSESSGSSEERPVPAASQATSTSPPARPAWGS